MQEEALLFEIGRWDTTGVDLDEPEDFTPRLGGLERQGEIGVPGLSEPETMRHFVKALPRRTTGIDTGLFALGSCTMKHNARLNEKMARLLRLRRRALRSSRSPPCKGALALMEEPLALPFIFVTSHRHDLGRASFAEGRRARGNCAG